MNKRGPIAFGPILLASMEFALLGPDAQKPRN
jgi:hypothetical protein